MAKFQKGQVANPGGRPKGIPDRRTELRSLLQPHAEQLVKQAVTQALNGDGTALRICIDRLIPPVKSVSEPLQTGIDVSGTAAEQAQAIFAAAADGKIGTDEAAALLQILQSGVKIAEATALAERVSLLEEQIAKGGA